MSTMAIHDEFSEDEEGRGGIQYHQRDTTVKVMQRNGFYYIVVKLFH